MVSIVRPATPGFIVTLTAAILLFIVSFSVPLFKSVFFLKASLSDEGISGSVTFGALGYCVELNNGTTCSKPSVGYELNINQLVGDDLPIQIPNVVVKWLTDVLVLHVVGFVLAAIAAFFGLLAHIREMSMTCFSSCISGFAAAVTFLAFIFDIVLFFVVRSRINDVKGGSATMGNAVWLTLAAWVLLFLSGCFFSLGRCCIRRRPDSYSNKDRSTGDAVYADQMRLDAMKAEADRKARQKQGEVGLPAFNEYESQPLTAIVDGDNVRLEDQNRLQPPYSDQPSPNVAGAGGFRRQPSQPTANAYGGGYAAGYAAAPPGTRAVDEYYNLNSNSVSPPAAAGYPPQPSREPSRRVQASSGYASSSYGYAVSPPNAGANSGYLMPAAEPQYGHAQYPSGQGYGHAAGGTTYHSAAESHQQYPSQYDDPFNNAPHHQPESSFNPETYNNTAAFMSSPPNMPRIASPPASPSFPARMPSARSPERNYTLGGGGYGGSTAYAPQEPASTLAYLSDAPVSASPPAINTALAPSRSGPSPRSPASPPRSPVSPVRGPREQRPMSIPYDDAPPMYDGPGPSQVWPRPEKR